MLSGVLAEPVLGGWAALAHAGRAPAPHDLWGAWNLDPLLLAGVAAAGWAYGRGHRRGRRPAPDWRARCFVAALAAVVVALVSPLDALAGALASAHMVQHLLLIVVAAPLLALSAPAGVLHLGSPAAVRPVTGRWWRRSPLRRVLRWGQRPVAAWLLHVATVWFWHAAVPYDMAVASPALHVVEHVSFLVTALLFWRVAIGPRSAGRVSNGFGVLLVFAAALQSVLLAVLLTFAPVPWYSAYRSTTSAWGLDPLSDQQLAGVLMWVPAGLAYLAAGLGLTVAWIRASEGEGDRHDPARAGIRSGP